MTRTGDLPLFVLLAVLWGGSFPAIKAGLAFFPPLQFAAVRYTLGGLLLLVYALAAGVPWRPRVRDDWVALAVTGLFLVAGNGLLFVGQQYATSGVGAVIYSLIPILTTAFAWPLLPTERHSRTGLVGVVLGFVGVVVVVSPDPSNLLAADVLGKVVILVAAASAALGSVLIRRAEPSLGIASMTAWGMLLGGPILLALGVATGEQPVAGRPALAGLMAMVYLVVLATALAFVIYFRLLDSLGPLEVNLVSYVVPVVATVVGWALLAEPVTVTTVVGFGLVLAGFGLLKREALVAELRPYVFG